MFLQMAISSRSILLPAISKLSSMGHTIRDLPTGLSLMEAGGMKIHGIKAV